ncbi:DUF5753 domain-containing protein [Streptomyces sp. NPDC007088]|uniref:DUF5753 domain-containing protein n=1 Tax=Streptomyces sp. NPDC007088 TaxID=3364773 RepID=UPI0036C24337
MGADLLASIEQGRRALKPEHAARLDELPHTNGVLSAALGHLPEVDRTPAWVAEYLGLEATAVSLSWYENGVLPGLLQTTDYARAILSNRVPPFDSDEINEQTDLRIERQAVFNRKPPPALSFVVWEPVLTLRLGTLAQHREQIQHLRTMADHPGVTIQILPRTATEHAGLDGPFILVETPDFQHIGYTEIQDSSRIIVDPNMVSILTRRYAMLRTQALNAKDTRGLLERLGE